jgi:hypothetical protein
MAFTTATKNRRTKKKEQEVEKENQETDETKEEREIQTRAQIAPFFYSASCLTVCRARITLALQPTKTQNINILTNNSYSSERYETSKRDV